MKRAFVKSAVVALAIMLISVSAFAADVSASVVMDGNLWGTDGLVIGNQNQKDADLIQISISDAQFGASFRLWAPLLNNITTTTTITGVDYAGTLSGTDGGIVQLRKANLWLKPIDMLKISIGNVSAGLFTEQLNWWMVPCAASVAQFAGWSPRWNSGAAFDVEGGLSFELTPIEGLFIAAGVAPGYGNSFMFDQDAGAEVDLVVGANTAFGVVAKYKIGNIGTVGASYRYNGGATAGDDVTSEWQNIRVGMDLTMVPGLYAFLQGVFMLETDPESPPDNTLTGVTIDNYVAYTAGAFSVKAEFPFTIRLLEAETDIYSGYMTFDVKAAYSLGAVSPFVRIRQNGDKDRGTMMIFFADDVPGYQMFAPAIDLGADMTLGKAAIMVALRVRLAPDEDEDIDWSIPFNVRVSW